MAGRIARLTPGFRRALRALAIVPGSPRRLALASTISVLAAADALPSATDFVTVHPGRAHVRRVAGQNLRVLYRFDAVDLDVLAVRDAPPVPSDEGSDP
jgi:hypothetical protein